jgi:hypothetical protein
LHSCICHTTLNVADQFAINVPGSGSCIRHSTANAANRLAIDVGCSSSGICHMLLSGQYGENTPLSIATTAPRTSRKLALVAQHLYTPQHPQPSQQAGYGYRLWQLYLPHATQPNEGPRNRHIQRYARAENQRRFKQLYLPQQHQHDRGLENRLFLSRHF